MSKYDDSLRKLAWFKLTGKDNNDFKRYNLVCGLMCISSLFIFSVGFYYWIETKNTAVFILSCFPAAVTRIYLDYFLNKGADFSKRLCIETARLHYEFKRQDHTNLDTFISQKRKQFAEEHAEWEYFLSNKETR